MPSPSTSVLELQSSSVKCNFCDSKLDVLKQSMKKSALMVIYTRNGTLYARHLVKRCQKRECRAGHFHGYTVKDLVRRYNQDVLTSSTYLGSKL